MRGTARTTSAQVATRGPRECVPLAQQGHSRQAAGAECVRRALPTLRVELRRKSASVNLVTRRLAAPALCAFRASSRWSLEISPAQSVVLANSQRLQERHHCRCVCLVLLVDIRQQLGQIQIVPVLHVWLESTLKLKVETLRLLVRAAMPASIRLSSARLRGLRVCNALLGNTPTQLERQPKVAVVLALQALTLLKGVPQLCLSAKIVQAALFQGKDHLLVTSAQRESIQQPGQRHLPPLVGLVVLASFRVSWEPEKSWIAHVAQRARSHPLMVHLYVLHVLQESILYGTARHLVWTAKTANLVHMVSARQHRAVQDVNWANFRLNSLQTRARHVENARQASTRRALAQAHA